MYSTRSNLVPTSWKLLRQIFRRTSPRAQIVHVQQILTIDITLAPGSAKQEVTTTAPLLSFRRRNAAIRQTIDIKAVNDLPLNGRDGVSLAQLSAGVATAPPANPSTAFCCASKPCILQQNTAARCRIKGHKAHGSCLRCKCGAATRSRLTRKSYRWYESTQ